MKGKILVIEDNELWQHKLRQYLESDGFFVEVVSDVETALKKVASEMYHFITIDMQLDEGTIDSKQYEGWKVLETITKLRLQDITPAMIITAFGKNYWDLKGEKKVESLFFMKKGDFNKKEFLDIVNVQVQRIGLRFKNDYRGD